MTTTAPARPIPPAAGLFGGASERSGSQRPALPLPRRQEPSASQRRSFADLFRADGNELHAA